MKAIGKYQVIEQLGASAAGVTYRVRDNFRNREFALKVFQTAPGVTSGTKEQFCAHLASCAELVHRHLLKVQDMGEVEEGLFVVSEWRTGVDLNQFMQDNPDLPLGQKLALGAQVAEGLAFAHSREIAHGDLKPGNIFVDGERDIMILDFGTAKWLAALLEAGCRPEGLVVNYLAPEQIMGEPFDTRSDIFALGLMLYQFISGKYPFSAAPGLIPREIVHTNVEPLRLLDPQIPEQLDHLVQRALLKDPGQRLQTAEEFAAGLYFAAQELRRRAAAAPAAPRSAERLSTESSPDPEPVVRQATAFSGPASEITEPQPRTAEQPVRERPQDAVSRPQPWTARSYASSPPLSREFLAAQLEQQPEQLPKPPAAPSIPPQPDPPAPSVEIPVYVPAQPAAAGLPDLRAQTKHLIPAKAPLITKRTIAILAGLILAAIVVGSFVSRKGLQASPNKTPAPAVVARPATRATPATPSAVERREPATPKPGKSGPDDLGNPEFSAKETLRGPVRSLWESGRYAEALALVNQVLANNPNNAEARAWKKKVRDAQQAEAALK